MNRSVFSARLARSIAAAFLLMISSGPGGHASEKVLHAFKGGSDGIGPYGGALIADSAGNLYGTTSEGGGATTCHPYNGCGAIFRIAPNGSESILYAFQGESDGALPDGGLVFDSVGNYYGETSNGGASDAGTVFRLGSDGQETVLYSFTGGSDGYEPGNDLVLDADGNLYGTAGGGYSGGDCAPYLGCGVIFEVNSSGEETVLYAFQSVSDGIGPDNVIRDGDGDIYGVTEAGGNICTQDAPAGCGTVYKLASDGSKTELYAFQGGNDGLGPVGSLVMDEAGNLYGVTGSGGNGCSNGCGTVFEVRPDGTEAVLYAFKGGKDGNVPQAGLIRDKKGNLYGTTFLGGGSQCKGSGCGAVFELDSNGKEKVLNSFNSLRGRGPGASLLLGADNKLFGTTMAGGKRNDGVVFEVKK